MTKTARIIFIAIFALMLLLPLFRTDLRDGVESQDERRELAPKAQLFLEDGSFNKAFPAGFEAWINDHIGFRTLMVRNNAAIRYYLFRVIGNQTDMYLGPKGELNYATEPMIRDYQHLNLHSEERLKEFADSLQFLSDYVAGRGGTLFYYQCWDKHSIYPEQFPRGVIQYGTVSKTDEMVRALGQYTTVHVISPKEELIAAKPVHDTYSTFCDPTHWSNRGAYIGYLALMERINRETGGNYRILTEDDYNITWADQGDTLFGGIHLAEEREVFAVRNPQAQSVRDRLVLYAEKLDNQYYTNPSADNRTRILLIGDSYFNFYISDDIAESFYETVIIHADHLRDVQNVIETYDPDIVVIESAERGDRSADIIDGVNAFVPQE